MIPAAQPTGKLPVAALLAMAMTGFTAIMTETLPAGLLPSIAEDMHVSSALAGQSVTAYAAGSLVAAIPLTTITQGVERRAVLLAAVIGFLVFNTITALAPTFGVMLLVRFLAGVAAGVAWGMLAGFARRLVSHSLAGRALAIAMIGTPVALSFGVPAGTLLGTQMGWRGAFLAMSATTVVLIVWILIAVPRTPGQPAHQRMTIRDVLRRPGIKPIMLTVFTWMTAHNILYTYIAPYSTLSGLERRVDVLLLAFGVAALAGIWHTGARVDRMLRRLVLMSLTLFIASSAAMALAPHVPWVTILAVIVWGFSFGGAATQLQTAAADAAGDGVDLASAINTTVWNGAIAAGGLVGGMLLQSEGPARLPLSAIVLAGVALSVSVRGHAYAFRRGPRALLDA
jgi:predicted MFS family arabinose efflux permease